VWTLNIELRPNSTTPLYLQVSGAVVADIAQGRLSAGDPLPGSRTLAASLGVHRNTILAAYDSLTSEGWLSTRPKGGTFVSQAVSKNISPPTVQYPAATQVHFTLPQAPEALYPWQRQKIFSHLLRQRHLPGALFMAHGLPDVRLFPAASLARCYRHVLLKEGRTTLDVGHAAGHPRARAALARLLASRRGMATEPHNTFITRGTVMSLRLIAEALVRPGAAIAVEDPGYPVAWEALHAAGAQLIPVAVDGDGLRVADLEAVLKTQPLCAVYVTPQHQYPTTVALSAARRRHLLQLARQHRFAIIEDDYDHAFHYEGPPVRPLASQDTSGSVIYTASLSKLLAPGLRLGYVAAPSQFIERLVELRRRLDVQGDATLELAVVALAQEGEIARHLRRAKRHYLSRRNALVESLQENFGDRLQVRVPSGGFNVWARLRFAEGKPVGSAAGAQGSLVEASPMQRWIAACAQRQVFFHPAQRYSFFAAPDPAARLCFATLTEVQLKDAAKRMQQALLSLAAAPAGVPVQAVRRRPLCSSR
jgi:GntR family transcriptional regulator/MocR family aminotransferase